jgi:hypothetical protein
VSLCVELFIAMGMNKAFVVMALNNLLYQMGVNKDLVTIAWKKMCVLLVVMTKGCPHNLFKKCS